MNPIDLAKGWLWDVLKAIAWQILGHINWWLVAATVMTAVIIFAVVGKLLGRITKAGVAAGLAFFLFAAGSWMLRPAPTPVVVKRTSTPWTPPSMTIPMPDLTKLAEGLATLGEGIGGGMKNLVDAVGRIEAPDWLKKMGSGPSTEELARQEKERLARLAYEARQRALANKRARRNRARIIGEEWNRRWWAEMDRLTQQARAEEWERQQQMQRMLNGMTGTRRVGQ